MLMTTSPNRPPPPPSGLLLEQIAFHIYPKFRKGCP